MANKMNQPVDYEAISQQILAGIYNENKRRATQQLLALFGEGTHKIVAVTVSPSPAVPTLTMQLESGHTVQLPLNAQLDRNVQLDYYRTLRELLTRLGVGDTCGFDTCELIGKTLVLP